MLVKIWLISAVSLVVLSALIGAVSIMRSGCHLYVRFDVEAARTFCMECAGLLSAAVCFLLMLIYVSNGGLADLPESENARVWFTATAMIILAGIITGAVAKLSFMVGKKLEFLWLKRQTLKQRAICRKLQQDMTKCCQDKELSTDDLVIKYIYCRKEVAKACPQPLPARCPIGMLRPFGMISDKEVNAIMEQHSSELDQLNEKADGHRVINLVEPEYFDPDSMLQTSLPYVMAEIRFLPYFEDGKEVIASSADIKGLKNFMLNFVSHDKKDEENETKSA